VPVKLALAAGLLLIALAAGATLAHAPLVVARDNSGVTHEELVSTTGPAEACQSREALPRETSAIRLGLTAVLGPRVAVRVLSGSRLLTRGTQAPGWEGASATVPVRPLARAFAPVTVCIRMTLLNGPVAMLGWLTHRATSAVGEGKHLPGRMHMEYLRAGGESWWSMATSTARRLGLGRTAAGTWNALLVMVLAAALIVLSSWLIARELR
jgi:hypothetical protein